MKGLEGDRYSVDTAGNNYYIGGNLLACREVSLRIQETAEAGGASAYQTLELSKRVYEEVSDLIFANQESTLTHALTLLNNDIYHLSQDRARTAKRNAEEAPAADGGAPAAGRGGTASGKRAAARPRAAAQTPAQAPAQATSANEMLQHLAKAIAGGGSSTAPAPAPAASAGQKPCFQFNETGTCKWGSSCTFKHG